MEKKDIASLFDALCERPLAGEADALSPDLEAFCRRAAEALSENGEMQPDPASAWVKDPDQFAGVLAAIYAGKETEAERDAFNQAAADSPALRLDGESALAFLDAIEDAAVKAPAHLVSALTTAIDEQPAQPRFWAVVAAWVTPGRSWRLASACAVLLVAGGLSWSVYRQEGQPLNPAPNAARPAANSIAIKALSPPVTQYSMQRPSVLAKPCDPGAGAIKAARAGNDDGGHPAKAAATSTDPACSNDADRRLAEKSLEDALGRQREAMRRAAAAHQAEVAARQGYLASQQGAAGFSGNQTGAMGSTAITAPPANLGAADAALPASPPAIGYGQPFQGAPPVAAMPARPSIIGR